MESQNFNEAGEPLMSAEALRYENHLESNPSNYLCDDCGHTHTGDCKY